MFRTQPYLEKSEYIQINLDTTITLPGNNQAQTKSGYKFTLQSTRLTHERSTSNIH